jgi:cytochrome c oxidase subunit 2
MNVAILWMCAAIAAAVFGVMLYSVATFRGAMSVSIAGRRRSPLVELMWALIPIAIVVVAVVPIVESLSAT